MLLEDVKNKASWIVLGESVYRRPKHVYVCPLIIADEFHSSFRQHLGFVKERADGRWDWHRQPTNYNNFKNEFWHVENFNQEQGVANTFEDAKSKVEEGWNESHGNS